MMATRITPEQLVGDAIGADHAEIALRWLYDGIINGGNVGDAAVLVAMRRAFQIVATPPAAPPLTMQDTPPKPFTKKAKGKDKTRED